LKNHGNLIASTVVETAERYSIKVDVINTTLISAHFTLPGASAYQASQFALMRLSEFVVAEYGAWRVNCLSLNSGGAPTGITKDLSPEVKVGKFPQIRLDRFENSRVDIYEEMTDTPDLCAGLVVWLTKGQRDWLNGRYVSATWDVKELEAKRDEIVEADKLKFRMVV
jgi:NAD(P)-dependent dehydrogenase (short-subunit alcohol dehydrogenase family)